MTVTPVKLNAKTQGSGEPVILIHGLFGSLSNLGMLGKFLAQFYTVHSLDVRNHGESPHVDTMDFPSMSSDVIKYMDDVGIPSAVVIGHSMGGKIAMQMALDQADRIKKLIIKECILLKANESDSHFQIQPGFRPNLFRYG